MRTLILRTGLLAGLLASIACSKGSGGGGSGETASATAVVLSVAQSPATISAGGSMTLTPNGGTPPYYFRLGTSSGTLSTASGMSATYTMDSAGDMGIVYIQDVNGVGTTVTLTSASGTIGTGGTTTAPIVTGYCTGTYTLNLAGTPGTMTLISDSSGDAAGNIQIAGGYAPIQGTCVNGTISFLNQFSGSSYTGTVSKNASTGQIWLQGSLTDVYGAVSSWYAMSQ